MSRVPVEERLLALEIGQRAHEARLIEGSATFETMRQELKTRTWVRWAQVVGVVGLVAAIAFAAGRYPDREEFDQSVDKVHEQLDAVDREVEQLGIEQVRSRAAAEATQRSVDRLQRTVEAKLDDAISDKRRR